jgi:predicted GTPase
MTVLERPEVAGRVTLHERGLAIDTELGFNEWRDLGLQLIGTTDRAMWSLGDWWNYGHGRFAKNYHDALRKLEAESRLVQVGARVARGFPAARRRQLSFELHAVVADADEDDQDLWLDEVERQGWGREQLTLAFVNAIPREPVAALSVRLVSDYHRLALLAAERRNMDPKEWVLEAIREKASREHVTLEEVAA